MTEFSGKTTYLWGVLRPNGTAVMIDPDPRGGWEVDQSLSVAGFNGDGNGEWDSWECGRAKRIASRLTDDLVELGVDLGSAQHDVVLFTLTTAVAADREPLS